MLVGCQRDATITTYVIPTKMPAVLAVEESRMLAAIVPQGDQAWFFKILGPKSAVDGVEATLRRFVKSVAFENGKPILSPLPDGWRRGGDKQMRYASIDIETPGKQLDLSISQLVIMEDWDVMVRRNVNRWRGQIGLEESEAPLAGAALLNPEAAPSSSARAPIWFDATGKENGNMSPPGLSPSPFAGKPIGDVPMGENDPGVDPHAGLPRDAQEAVAQAKAAAAAASQETMPESPGFKKAANVTSGAATAQNDPRLSFETPESWRPGRMSSMRMAALAVGSEENPAEITVIIAGGDLRGNVARWMGQVAGSPPDEDAVDKQLAGAQKLEVDGRPSQRFIILPDANNGTNLSAVDATIVPLQDGFSLFVKMTGPQEVVSAQSEAMGTFLSSLRFKE